MIGTLATLGVGGVANLLRGGGEAALASAGAGAARSGAETAGKQTLADSSKGAAAKAETAAVQHGRE